MPIWMVRLKRIWTQTEMEKAMTMTAMGTWMLTGKETSMAQIQMGI